MNEIIIQQFDNDVLDKFLNNSRNITPPTYQYKFYMKRKNRVYFKQDWDGRKISFTLSDVYIQTLLSRFKVGQNVSMKMTMVDVLDNIENIKVVAKEI